MREKITSRPSKKKKKKSNHWKQKENSNNIKGRIVAWLKKEK
jgi:hypothetical protein